MVFVVGGGLYSDCWMVELLLGVVVLRFCFARLELLIVLLFFFYVFSFAVLFWLVCAYVMVCCLTSYGWWLDASVLC